MGAEAKGLSYGHATGGLVWRYLEWLGLTDAFSEVLSAANLGASWLMCLATCAFWWFGSRVVWVQDVHSTFKPFKRRAQKRGEPRCLERNEHDS